MRTKQNNNFLLSFPPLANNISFGLKASTHTPLFVRDILQLPMPKWRVSRMYLKGQGPGDCASGTQTKLPQCRCQMPSRATIVEWRPPMTRIGCQPTFHSWHLPVGWQLSAMSLAWPFGPNHGWRVCLHSVVITALPTIRRTCRVPLSPLTFPSATGE